MRSTAVRAISETSAVAIYPLKLVWYSPLGITGNDAEQVNRALEEVKAKFYEKSETSLEDTQALDAFLSSLRNAGKEEPEKEQRHADLGPLGKRLMLGTVIERQGDTRQQ